MAASQFIGFDDEALAVATAAAKEPSREELIAAATAARDRKDWPAALTRWQSIRERLPEEWLGYTGAAQALRELGRMDEAEAVLREAAVRFPEHRAVLHDLGRLKEAREDWAAAETCWRGFLAIDATPWWAHTSLANTLNRQERVAEAEAVLIAAQERLPPEPPLFIDHARLAEGRGEWEAALARWQNVCARFPQEWVGYGGAARALRELGRTQEAEELLLVAAERFPEQATVQHDLARIAEARGDWAAAEQRWRRFLVIDAKPWWAYAGLARVLTNQRRIEDAEAVLRAGQALLPHEAPLFLEYARLAEDKKNWVEALRRLNTLRQQLPDEWQGYVRSASVLCELGRYEDAETIIRAAREKFPDQLEVIRGRAHVAYRRGAWSEAYARFAEVQKRDPQLTQDWAVVADLRQHLAALSDADSVAAVSVEPAAIAANEMWRELYLKFENIGANCEFGLVQRRFGAEPLGLMRWAAARPEQLVFGLNSRFADVGNPQRIRLERDRSYFRNEDDWDAIVEPYLRLHTYIPADDSRKSADHELICRRLRFMRDEFLEDLEDGDKVYVYKELGFRISRKQVSDISSALRAYNKDNRLFIVHLANQKRKPGDVYWMNDGVLAGCLEKDAAGGAIPELIPFSTWHQIIQKAAEMFGL